MKKKLVSLEPPHQPLWLVRAMTVRYCKEIHRSTILCPRCAKVLAFEEEKTKQCETLKEKIHCVGCYRQCYSNSMRLEINHIIRWAEPRMRWQKYWLGFCHHLRDHLFRNFFKID